MCVREVFWVAYEFYKSTHRRLIFCSSFSSLFCFYPKHNPDVCWAGGRSFWDISPSGMEVTKMLGGQNFVFWGGRLVTLHLLKPYWKRLPPIGRHLLKKVMLVSFPERATWYKIPLESNSSNETGEHNIFTKIQQKYNINFRREGCHLTATGYFLGLEQDWSWQKSPQIFIRSWQKSP